MNREGGNVFVNVAELSVPFGLLFALKAYQKKKEKKTKSQKGGECMLCNKNGGKSTIKDDIEYITSNLKELLKNSHRE